jgi:small GTP-binding protein
VKIDKKVIHADSTTMNLMLWDLAGEDEFQTVRDSYLRGASGYMLVADGTRYATLDTVVTLQQRAEAVVGQVPFLLLMNKADLDREWQVDERALVKLAERGWPIVKTSAKTGAGVEDAFVKLAHAMAVA